MIKVAVVGCGFWGALLGRTLTQIPDYHLRYFCDLDSGRLDLLKARFGYVNITDDLDNVLRDVAVDALFIATPISTHEALAAKALDAGKHVFVEQPMARSSEACARLIEQARGAGRVLMVGHIDRYNAAVRRLCEYIESGELGRIHYLTSHRLNLGGFSRETGTLWELASHDLFITSYVLGAWPVRVSAKGISCIQPGIEDALFLNLDYPGGVSAHAEVSWLYPTKVRRVSVVGSEKMVIYDDVSQEAKITVFDRRVSLSEGPAEPARVDNFGLFQLSLHAGDIYIPKLDLVEPLHEECRHFAECITKGGEPSTDGETGLKVVRVLEAAQRSLENNAVPVDMG